jgi:hypothetical protein
VASHRWLDVEEMSERSGPAPRAERDPIGRAVEDVLDEELPSEGRPAPRVRVDVPEEDAPADALAERKETPRWAERLVRFLDDGIKIPGTDVGFGADAIIGFFFPGVGDMVTGSGSLALLYLALKERVPTVILGRMVMNMAIDSLLGSFPIVGDVFDLFFRANRKNLELIEKYRDDPDAKPSALDYVLVGTGTFVVALSVILPMLIVWLLAGAGILAIDSLFGG